MKRELLAEINPEALVMNEFDDALIGYVERCGQPSLALYDVNKVVAVCVKQGMSEDEAIEYVQFNITGAWMGEQTPAFAVIWGDDIEEASEEDDGGVSA